MITRAWMALDRFAFPLTVLVLLVTCVATGPTLREFSSFLSVVCFMGLLWRVIGSVRQMDVLAFVLSLVLAANLATAAVAQYTLANSAGPPPPSNTLGLIVVLVSRTFALVIIGTWNYWLLPRRALWSR